MKFDKVPDQALINYYNMVGAAYTNELLSGKWQIGIIMLLGKKKLSFSGFKKEMPLITESVLARKLKELEKQNIIKKKIFPQIPPRTEYSLTEKGHDLYKIANLMQEFGLKYNDRLKKITNKKGPSRN